jgi:hypothetical protein
MVCSFFKLFEIEFYLQKLCYLTFFKRYGKKRKERGLNMSQKVLGCDVSKDYIILHDGGQAYKFSLENFLNLQKLVVSQ